MTGPALVVGPAYLDRVLRVAGPLLDPAVGGPLDRSVEGQPIEPGGPTLALRDPAGNVLAIDPPEGWPGPTGTIALAAPLVGGVGPWTRRLAGRAWLDDLGGMGAGYARALGATLVSALGPESDPTSRAVADLLAREGIDHRPVRVPDHPADWTLLLTSGPHGDKLPIGFRGCHASAGPGLVDAAGSLPDPSLIVVAGLPNRTVEDLLAAIPAAVRMFAPALRNTTSREPSASSLAGLVDVVACNLEEWLATSETARRSLRLTSSLLSITDGPRGATVVYLRHGGGRGEVTVPAFPRRSPPRDTNRAGEAFASTLVRTLLEGGWLPGARTDEATIRAAARRASAASALVLDIEGFGFPAPGAIDAALRAGIVGDEPVESPRPEEGAPTP
jgi:sugar/nucleoside kinase (ribokinase family)